MMDKKFHVGEGGYFTRKLVELLYPIRVAEQDCGTQYGLVFSRYYLRTLIDKIVLENQTKQGADETEIWKEKEAFVFRKLFLNRFVRRNNAGWELVGEDTIGQLMLSADDIILRSPVTCETKDGMLCSRCLGGDPSKVRGPFAIRDFVGVMAGHTIGERGTQLSMKTFQTGDYGFRMQRISSFFLNLRVVLAKGALGYLDYFKGICLTSVNQIMSDFPTKPEELLSSGEERVKIEASLLQTIDVISLHLEILYREMLHNNLKSEAEMIRFLTDWKKRGFFTALSFENPRRTKNTDKKEAEKNKEKKTATVAEEFGTEKTCLIEVSPKASYVFCLKWEDNEYGNN
jgi:hypothetical protein